MRDLMGTLAERAKSSSSIVVLPEGSDVRILQAAVQAARMGLCTPLILGNQQEVETRAEQTGIKLSGSGVRVVDPTDSDLSDTLAEKFYERRKARGLTAEQATTIIRENNLYFGGMMVDAGYAAGMVAGAQVSTGDVLRAAFHCVGTSPGIKLASSMFLMELSQPSPGGEQILMLADCGVNPLPTAEDLVDIALATVHSYQHLLQKQPRLAFLSFSTKGSAAHEMVEKMQLAYELTCQRFQELKIDAVVDGELQVDAALVPEVAAQKNKGGEIQGNANVLIFPDLQSGNIAYKLVERLADARAFGPLLQGVAKPVNDLSRGCSVDDIIGVICVTLLQR